jgi:hypothetical protein
VQWPISHEGYSQPVSNTWDKRHKRNQPGNDLQPQGSGMRVLVLLLLEPGRFSGCSSNGTNATPLLCVSICRCVGEAAALHRKRRVLLYGPIDRGNNEWIGKGTRNWFEIERACAEASQRRNAMRMQASLPEFRKEPQGPALGACGSRQRGEKKRPKSQGLS